MIDPKFIDDLAQRLARTIPDSVRTLQRDLEGNLRAVLQAGLGRLDMVSRDEFDVQAGVLRRTREKLAAFEARIAALEKRLAATDTDPGGDPKGDN